MEGVYDDTPPPTLKVRRRERIDPMAGDEDDDPPPKPTVRPRRQRVDPMADDHGPDLRLVKTDDEPKPEGASAEPPWWFDEMVKPVPGFGQLSPERQAEFGRVAAFLQSIVGADGSLPDSYLVQLEDAGFSPGIVQDVYVRVMTDAGVMTRCGSSWRPRWSLPVREQAVRSEPQRKPSRRRKSKREPVTGQTPWRKPTDQNDHLRGIRESRRLKGNARLVAYEAHVQFGLESASKGTPFAETTKELTAEYLAMFTGLSEKTVRTAMDEACRLGHFHRLDNRAGGRRGRNRATYRPTVPEV